MLNSTFPKARSASTRPARTALPAASWSQAARPPGANSPPRRRLASYEDPHMPENEARWTKMSPIPFLMASWFARLVAIGALVLIILMILPYPLRYVENADQYEYL